MYPIGWKAAKRINFTPCHYTKQRRNDQDTRLIAKLSEGDMTSRDACYPHKCIAEFTNSDKRFVNDHNKNEKNK